MRGVTVRLTFAQSIEADYTSAAWEELMELIRALHLGQPLPEWTRTGGSPAVDLDLPVAAGAERYAHDMPYQTGDVAYSIAGRQAIQPVGTAQVLMPGVTGPVDLTFDTHPGEPWPPHGHLVVLYVHDGRPYAHEDQELLILVPRAPAGPAW